MHRRALWCNASVQATYWSIVTYLLAVVAAAAVSSPRFGFIPSAVSGTEIRWINGEGIRDIRLKY